MRKKADRRDRSADRARDARRSEEEARAIKADQLRTAGKPAPESQKEGEAPREEIAATDVRGLGEIACSVFPEFDFGRRIRALLDATIKVLGAKRGVLFLGRPEGAWLVPVLAKEIGGQELKLVQNVSRTILSRGQAGETVITQDALLDPRFHNVESVKLNEIHSIICMPLKTRNQQIGALYYDAKDPDAFPKGMKALVEGIASVAAVAIESAQRQDRILAENESLKQSASEKDPLSRLAGKSSAIEELRGRAMVAASLDRPILIIGEPGSGRRMIAETIHSAGKRAGRAFELCDCNAVPEKLLKEIMVGRAGTATHLKRGVEPGLLHRASKGTLCLANAEHLTDEVAEVLEQVIVEKSFRPLGGRHDETCDINVILTTKPRDGGRTGQDGLPQRLLDLLPEPYLVVPPLRDRTDDIPDLVDQMLREDSRVAGESVRLTFSSTAIDRLKRQSWSGNARQLQHVIRWIGLLASEPVVEAPLVEEALGCAMTGEPKNAGSPPVRPRTLLEWEELAIRHALSEARGSKTEAARILGIHRNTLAIRMKSMGIG